MPWPKGVLRSQEPSNRGITFHNERYELAALFCHRANVLEVECGAGYGAEILSRRAWYVRAIDYSVETIGYCKKHYPCDNVDFEVQDITQWRPEYPGYDVVVAYEVIEHITDGRILMQLIKDALKPHGMAFISTPSPVAHGSKFHVHEYDLEEFENLLSAHFQKHVILNHRPGTFSFQMKDAHTYIGVVYG